MSKIKKEVEDFLKSKIEGSSAKLVAKFLFKLELLIQEGLIDILPDLVTEDNGKEFLTFLLNSPEEKNVRKAKIMVEFLRLQSLTPSSSFEDHLDIDREVEEGNLDLILAESRSEEDCLSLLEGFSKGVYKWGLEFMDFEYIYGNYYQLVGEYFLPETEEENESFMGEEVDASQIGTIINLAGWILQSPPGEYFDLVDRYFYQYVEMEEEGSIEELDIITMRKELEDLFN